MSNLNLNKVILGGRISTEVELKQTQSGVAVCSFGLAVNRKRFKDNEQQTDFVNCTAWRGTAEFISKYFHKGSSICIVGSIQTRSWENSQGNKRYATEVVADEAMFVDGKNDEKGTEASNPNTYIPDAYMSQNATNFEAVEQDEMLPF